MSTAPQVTKPGSFGERMKREREMRGVKLEEIAESTKIGKRNLIALEEEQFDQLPGGIFNKGFVRAYARYLGLDEEQAVNDYLAACGNPEPALPSATSLVKPPAMPSEAAVERKNRRWMIAALLILVSALAAWLVLSRRPELNPFRSAANPESRPAGSAPAPAEPVAAAPQSQAQTDQPISSGAEQPQSSTIQSALPAKTSTSDSGVPLAGSESPPTGVTVTVRATSETWLTLTADGQPLSDVTLLPGESREFHALKQLVLKTGNAGGLDATLNGKSIGPLGKDKQVKTLTFTAGGVQ